MNVIIVGQIGSDAGYWVIGPDGKWHHVGGWNPEAIAELSHAVDIMRAAVRLKTPGVADAAVKSVAGLVQKELGAHMKEGGVLVLG